MENNNITKASFLKDFIQKAAEHSKRLTIIDIVLYVVMMLISLALLFFKPELADAITTIILYLTTAYVSVRLGYSLKSAMENVQKIKNSGTDFYNEEDG